MQIIDKIEFFLYVNRVLRLRLLRSFKVVHPLIDSRFKNKTKYFCIGRNKTGTTPLKFAFERLGFCVGDQRVAENIYYDGFDAKNYKRLSLYCNTAEVYQDLPFSANDVYKILDREFPGSKFILSVRDTPQQWVNSYVNFHSKIFANGTRIPSYKDLIESNYIRSGSALKFMELHGTTQSDPYNKAKMIEHYVKYNEDVRKYFEGREEDFIEVNISSENDYKRFESFLNRRSDHSSFPWKNKT